MFARVGAERVGTLLAVDAVIAMPEIGLSLPLAAADDGIEFPPSEGTGDADPASQIPGSPW
jgi:hypothetical protein